MDHEELRNSIKLERTDQKIQKIAPTLATKSYWKSGGAL